jgi:hypothetical protein
VPTWRPGVQDAENDPQRRSQSPVSLQRTPQGYASVAELPAALLGCHFEHPAGMLFCCAAGF